MGFYPFHISVANLTYILLGGFTVFFGMFSLLIREKLYVGEAILAFLFGVIIGPYGANIFNPRSWGNGSEETVSAITLEVTRVVLAVGVFAIGVELPSKYIQKHWKSILFLIGPVMAVGWVVCAGFIYALVPALDFLSSLAIAACLTPTDPILAAAVINGRYAEKHVPEHIRHLLSCESGCNDGAAFPFLFISLYLILEADPKVAVGEWFYITWLYEITLGILIGTAIGYGFRHLMKFCESRDLIDRHSYVAQYISLALLSDGLTALLGSDDLLAAFCSGAAFAWDSHFNKQTADSVFSAVLDLLFNVAIFVFIGAWMPFSTFYNEHTTITVWRLVVIAILIIMFRRLPVILVLYRWIPDIKTLREAVFSGHFGPMGVGAIFIGTLALEKLPHPHDPPESRTDILSASIEPIISFMVMCSILIHGLSIPFFKLGGRVQSLTLPRTWSLRGNHEPEWAGQTMKVTRPEDIVVNRDVLPHPGTVLEKEMEEGRAEATTTSGSEVTRKANDPEGSIPGEMENTTVREWREGRHLVREYHPHGPGEEVRVEVIRDAFDSSGSESARAIKATFSVAENAIRDEVMRYLGTFSGRTSLEKSKSRPSIEQTRQPAADIEESPVVVRLDDDEDEEEWQDEPDSDQGSQSKRTRDSSPAGSGMRHRRTGRSSSIRRTALGTARSSRRGSVDSTPAEPASPASPASPVQPVGTNVGFQRTDSIVSVRSGDRVNVLRGGVGVDTPQQVRSRDSSPNRTGVRFASALSRPTSRSGSPQPHHNYHNHPHNQGYETPAPQPQRSSALKPMPKR
ncbi:hypothetical protein M408DRAFT_328997 [Serendipita vermifera MAFF 305830]|uniref:Cation/H+ exchanger transmembrane domain-containing protein n=1 Tax=Serendipita vermifera MAFF 305830 TaxID=933852 RepID=A0A0C3BBW6_SERVB|nr:hypothetical protein M408DRAFT_328997 [Serendipita vermifera MAFF 305830]